MLSTMAVANGQGIRRSSVKSIVSVVAFLFVAAFAVLWCVLCVQVLRFSPMAGAPSFSLAQAQVVIAGFLATTVGAGTASVLGITVAEVVKANGAGFAAALNQKVKTQPLLIIGVLAYFLVGLFVLGVYFFNSAKAPEMFGAFALSALGWAGGAFSAVFKAP
jgi:hypothetical protein